MQVTGPAVVAQARPDRQHLVEICGRQGPDGGKSFDEPVVVVDDRADLSLLQHELGQELGVGVVGAPPPRKVAVVAVVPFQQTAVQRNQPPAGGHQHRRDHYRSRRPACHWSGGPSPSGLGFTISGFRDLTRCWRSISS